MLILYIEKDKCKQCHGKKTEREQKILEVHVEKGMEDGQKITFGGEADEEPGIKPGDVVIILDEKDHAVFKRKKNNLYINLDINLVEAVCGFEKYIQTLDDRWLKMNSPPGEVIKPGDVKVISEEGMPVYGRSISKGNMFIKFNVVFPPQESITVDCIRKLKELLPKADEPIIPDGVEECVLEDIDPDETNFANNQRHYVVSIKYYRFCWPFFVSRSSYFHLSLPDSVFEIFSCVYNDGILFCFVKTYV